MGDEMLATLFGADISRGYEIEGLSIGKFRFSSEREDYVIWLSPIGGGEMRRNSFTLNLYHVPTHNAFSGHFTSAYISQLTQKTGSIKDFKTFLNMLKSALSQKSRSVNIEFLSTEEINALKSSATPTGSGLSHKCYILLSYCSEFDRVRYPIPLTFIGKLSQPDLLEYLLKTICSKVGHFAEVAPCLDREKESEEVNRLLQNKRELEEEICVLKQYQRSEDKHTQPSKEIKVLKRVIRNLEEDLMHEKSQHTKFSNKKIDEYAKLHSELDHLRASERTLKIRVKNLTEELAAIRRHRVSMSPIVPFHGSGRKRSLSADRGKSNTPVSRYQSKQRSTSRRRSSSLEKPVSTERMSRRDEFLRAQKPSGPAGHYGLRSRTPSPRFDPTAYVREQRRKRTESGGKNNRGSTRRSGSNTRSRSQSRERNCLPPTLNEGRWSHYSSASSFDSSTDDFVVRETNCRRRQYREIPHSLNSIRDSSTPVQKRPSRTYTSRGKETKPSIVQPKSKSKQALDHSINLSDIDQRLEALKFLINEHP